MRPILSRFSARFLRAHISKRLLKTFYVLTPSHTTIKTTYGFVLANILISKYAQCESVLSTRFQADLATLENSQKIAIIPHQRSQVSRVIKIKKSILFYFFCLADMLILQNVWISTFSMKVKKYVTNPFETMNLIFSQYFALAYRFINLDCNNFLDVLNLQILEIG